jgi:DNA-binding NtrC family response regulator
MKPAILIVDDEELLCEGLSRILKEQGYSVNFATGGTGALQMIREKEYDLILLDINLHGESGIDLLPEIRTASPHSPVIIISAYNDVCVAVKAMKAGAHDYFVKSSDCTDLLTMIRTNLHGSDSSEKTCIE